MDLNILERDDFYVCGYSVETTLEQNDKDVSTLYNDFFEHDKEAILMDLKGSKRGYYGLSWYTEGHKTYYYLLGIEVGQENTAPENAIIKKICKAKYAVARFPENSDIINAWTEFYYKEIPKAGLIINEEQNLYFEYYPSNVKGEYELWIPVVNTDI